MVLLWNTLHLVLTIIVTPILIFTYRNIAKPLDENFWDPLYRQFVSINRKVRKLRTPRKSCCDNSVQLSNAENKWELISTTVKLEGTKVW